MAKLGRAIRGSVLAVVLLGLASCATSYRNHGYIPSEDDLANIVVGVDTRDSVAETVGTPSSAGVLNDSGYYYVRSRVRHLGPTEPRVVDRQVVAISFDGAGVVSNVERFSLEDGKVVPLARRVTKGGVRDFNFLRQLVGAFGRIDPAAALGG